MQQVYGKAGMRPFSEQLLKHQLCLLQKVAAADSNSPLRKDTFVDETLIPQIGRFVRRVGRPRQDWTSQLLREGRERMGSQRFEKLLRDRSEGAQQRWKQELERLFN